jgi:TonB family protein
MARDARFWRNVAIITVAHLVVVLALARGSREVARPNLETVVWVNSQAAAVAPEPKNTPAPTPVPSPREVEKPEESHANPALKSEIVLPSPTPTATATPTAPPKPSPTPTPKNSPKPTPKPTPKETPKKSAEPKATPKPSPKKSPEEADKKAAAPKKESSPSSNSSPGATATPGKGSGSGATQAPEFGWYGAMLHDRFHKAWEQPTSIVASGARMSTIVKIRIEKDGRVSKFAIVKPSGNVVVDESVSAIAQKVTQVDPLPEGLSKGAFYEVKIDFELNAGK